MNLDQVQLIAHALDNIASGLGLIAMAMFFHAVATLFRGK
jgi:hypothetical protein